MAEEPPVVGAEIGLCGYRALLIAVASYDDARIGSLDTPGNDVEALEEVLKQRYGFRTEVLRDPTREQVLRSLEAIEKEVADCEAVVVYYAGHGVYDEATKEGYWLPADASEDSRTNWVSNADVASSVNALGAQHVWLVSDSCFAGSLFRSSRAAAPAEPPAVATARRLARKESRWVMTSGGMEPVVDQYRDGLSVFAYFLRQELADAGSRYVTPEALFPRVRELVSINAGQIPQEGAFPGHEGGTMVLVHTEVGVPPDDRVARVAPVDREGPEVRRDPPAQEVGPTVPSGWLVGGLGVGAVVVGLGVVVARRRRSSPPMNQDYRRARQEAYQALWDRVEALHVQIRREALDERGFDAAVVELNSFLLEQGVVLDDADGKLASDYVHAVVALKRATKAAGGQADEAMLTTAEIPTEVLAKAHELAEMNRRVTELRDALRAKVRAQYEA